MAAWLQPDYALIAGLLLILLSAPSLLAAMADRRRPDVATLLVLAGAVLVWWAWDQTGGYTLEDIPNIVIEIIARIVN